MYTTPILFSALGAALPPHPPPYYAPAPLSTHEFGLTMYLPWTQDTIVPLIAVQNGTNPDLVLIGSPSSQPTPAYTNNTQPMDPVSHMDYTCLNMDVKGISYGLFAADVGLVDGIATTVLAVKGKQEERWNVADGQVWHQPKAARNTFLACNGTVNGKPASYLGWGNYRSDGSPPADCWYTTVKTQLEAPAKQT